MTPSNVAPKGLFYAAGNLVSGPRHAADARLNALPLEPPVREGR